MTEFSKASTFTPTSVDSPITSLAVAIAAHDGTEFYVAGTGVFVTPGLVLTAKHVVEEFWKRMAGRPRPRAGVAAQGPFDIHVLQFPGNDSVPALWLCERVWTAKHTDVAFLQVVPNGQTGHAPWRGTPALNPYPPARGERIFAFGYPASSGQIASQEPFGIEWLLQGHTTVGQVTEVYPERRERGFLNFPCFETDARFDGGMSGGPIFDSAGRICGLICGALGGDTEGSFTSYGAVLWPALLTSIDFRAPGLDVKGPYGAWELSRVGRLRIDHWDDVLQRVIVEQDDSGAEVVRLNA